MGHNFYSLMGISIIFLNILKLGLEKTSKNLFISDLVKRENSQKIDNRLNSNIDFCYKKYIFIFKIFLY